ncbi:MAG: hypothetical protein R3335_10975 [Anaerolineales bacterium]|nr:hypothetical protein [Anaerolineales bacterium]
MLAPQRIWWTKLGRLERNWLVIALVWCIALTAMMPIWFIYGRQNVPITTFTVTAEQFERQVMDFSTQYQVGEEKGIPVVEPPPGDIYMYGKQWQWYPILRLKKGETYNLHLSSLDVLHGFSLQPVNLNFMVVPGYDYVATLVPTTSGEFSVVCNEYCLLGHHIMVGKIYVDE